MERLERFERLQRLEKESKQLTLYDDEEVEVEYHQGDYRDVVIPQGAVVYCDIPYIGTAAYLNEFNHSEFYDWCKNNTNPVYISEYTMPSDFKCVWQKEKSCTYSATSAKKTIEKLFWNKQKSLSLQR